MGPFKKDVLAFSFKKANETQIKILSIMFSQINF